MTILHHLFIDKEIRFASLSSLFILLFLLLFQPFAIARNPIDEIIYSVSLISSLHFLIYLLLHKFLHYFSGHQSFFTIIVFRTISFMLLVGVFTKIGHWLLGLSPVGIYNFAYWMYGSFLVMSIPYGIKLYLTYEQQSSQISPVKAPPSGTKVFSPDLKITSPLNCLTDEQLLYIKAMENYAQFIWENEERIEKQIYRVSLKTLEKHIKNSNIVKCHRSYIINKIKIVEISGNVRSYKAKIKTSKAKLEVPISKNRISFFKKSI